MALAQPRESTSATTPIVVWILQIGLGMVYVMAGLGKLTGNAAFVTLFRAIGVGEWLRYAIGAVEISCGLLLFTPALSGLAALALIPVMFGAIYTTVIVPTQPTAPAVLCCGGLIALAWLRRVDTRRLLRQVTRR